MKSVLHIKIEGQNTLIGYLSPSMLLLSDQLIFLTGEASLGLLKNCKSTLIQKEEKQLRDTYVYNSSDITMTFKDILVILYCIASVFYA